MQQGNKVRQIDDFSKFFVNGCTAVEERVDLDGIDQIVNLSKAWVDLTQKANENEGTFEAAWEDGSVARHKCHEDFLKPQVQIQGSCINLESAYKQCPVSMDHERFSVFALRHPNQEKVEFFFAKAFPFGAKAAVHGFNRASRAMNILVHAYGGVTTGTYFDDFPMVAPEQLSRNMYKRMII